jgi:GAF domain-containing protein
MRDPLIPQQPDSGATVHPCWAPWSGAVTASTCSDDGSLLSAGALAESMRTALSGRSAQESLHIVIEMVLDTGPCDQASITTPGPGRTIYTVASSDDRASKADLLHHQLDEGPALDTALSDQLLLSEDLSQEPRWPQWAPRATGLGIGALISVHLHTDTALGSLNLYSEQAREYDDIDVEAARVIAAHASIVLAHTRSTQNLRRGMNTRNLIGQAQGILMARHRLTPDQAFEALRRHSQTTNTRLTVLAEELISTGQLHGLEQQIHQSRVTSRTGRCRGAGSPDPTA